MCPWMHGAQHHGPRNNTGHDSNQKLIEMTPSIISDDLL